MRSKKRTREREQTGEKIEELKKDIDITQDLVSWTKTPAGQDTINKLRHEARKAMNEMFSVLHEKPEIAKLISAVARFEATVQMTKGLPERKKTSISCSRSSPENGLVPRPIGEIKKR